MSHSITYVSSVVYNLAGDVDKRANFLKTTVVGAVFRQTNIAEAITNGYLKGPGITLRSFAKWSRTQGYSNTVGLVTGSFFSTVSLNTEVIKGQLPVLAGYSIVLQNAEVGPADYIRWAEQYMGINYPLELEADWIADYDASTNLITITRTNATQVVFSALGFDSSANYLFARYSYLAEPVISAINYGATTYGDFPVLVNPTVIQDTTTNTVVPLTKTTVTRVTWSDATPTTTTTSTTSSTVVKTDFYRVLAQSVLVAPRTYEDRTYFMTQTGSKVSNDVVTVTTTNMGAGVTRTTTETVTTESVTYVRETRINYVTRTLTAVKPTQTLIYSRYSGNAVLDTMFNGNGSMGTFFPYIPIRIENTFISPTYYPNVYAASKKAVRKATSSSFDKVVKSLSVNPQLGDIDFAYMIFGISLNTKENECRRYLYTFFEQCAAQSNDSITFAEWKAANAIREAAITEYNARSATGDLLVWNPTKQIFEYVPLPVIPPYVDPPSYSLDISSANLPGMNFNINLSWTDMTLTTGTGLGRLGAKVGELWFEQLAIETVSSQKLTQTESGAVYESATTGYERVALVFQETSNRWRKITLLNFLHRNFVYQGKVVTISAGQALASVEESGFVVPLHEAIFANTPIVSRTQMANSCAYLMLNSYTIVAQRHYRRNWFTIILIIIIIVVVVFYPPAAAALGQAGGLLGANLTVGAALGLTGVTAILVGAAINAIAGMILVNVLTAGATAIFGEKIGAIIGFIASMVVIQVGTAITTGQQISMSAMFNNMMKAENLMKLTMAVGNGISQYINASTIKTLGETAKVIEDYKVKSKDIADKYDKEFGTDTNALIDPMMFTDVMMPGYEPSVVFLNRTLLTGSDIAEMSLEMISKFSELTLNLDLQT